MDKERLERFARLMEPFERANKMMTEISAAARLADAFPRINPAVSNLNRRDLTAKVNSISSSWNMKALHSHDFPVVNQFSAVNQQALANALGLSKSIIDSNRAATRVLNTFKASSLVVSNAVLEFTERNRAFSEKIAESFKLVPEAFLVLGNHGWYLNLDFELGIAVQLLGMLNSGKIGEVDDFLVTYFNNELNAIAKDLIARHPARKNIFEDIIFCVEHKKFFAAIPTVLSQVDGICTDMIKMKFFSKDHKRGYIPKISVYISDQFPLVDNFFFAPIMGSPIIMLSEHDAKNHPFQINRHTVMHGMDVN
ncbi:hypothetical protein [Dyadobacter sp. 3J3]|uniref:hypothetical protein n=1 Tax=Dyadobacter sp. 3J3 TaxID=2606600 RepID=UPI0013587068|nr:hypothetical protein [Dyadobacter sp. 3J3]